MHLAQVRSIPLGGLLRVREPEHGIRGQNWHDQLGKGRDVARRADESQHELLVSAEHLTYVGILCPCHEQRFDLGRGCEHRDRNPRTSVELLQCWVHVGSIAPRLRLRRYGWVGPNRGAGSGRRDDQQGRHRRGRLAIGAVLPAQGRELGHGEIVDHDVEVELLWPAQVGPLGRLVILRELEGS